MHCTHSFHFQVFPSPTPPPELLRKCVNVCADFELAQSLDLDGCADFELDRQSLVFNSGGVGGDDHESMDSNKQLMLGREGYHSSRNVGSGIQYSKEVSL